MSSIETINHVNTTLFNILRESIGPEIGITFGSPVDEEVAGDNTPRLYMFLYNIIEDPFSKNKPDESRGGRRILSFRPPLAVNLYYMLTPFSIPRSSTTREPPDRVQAHTIVAQAMRGFHDNGVIDPRFFPANTTLGESQVRISLVQMNLEEITKIWSSFNRPFRLSVCYEVSIVRIQSEERPREIRLVEKAALSAGGGGGGGAASTSENEFEVIPAIGKRNLSKLKEKGWNVIAMRSDHIADIADVKPLAIQPGMALSIYGRDFKGKKLILKIGERTIIDGREIDAQVDAEVNRAIRDSQEINEALLRTLLKALLGRLLGTSPGIDDAQVDAEVNRAIRDSQEINEALLRTLLKALLGRLLGTSFRVINENLIKVKIPPDEEPGIKRLSLASEEEEEEEGEEVAVVATFEVLPAEPRLITITEIRPDKGISDDLITIMGINFTEDARVSIGDRKIEKITFVDNAQINIMIPSDLNPGTTTLTVSTDQGSASRPFRIL